MAGWIGSSSIKMESKLSAFVLVAILLPSLAHTSPPQPVVLVNDDCLMGGVKDGKWLDGKAIAPLVAKGQKYNLYLPGGKAGEMVCSEPDAAPDNAAPGRANDFEVRCPYDKEKTDRAVIAFASAHNPLPRPVKELRSPAPEHTEAIRKFLVRKGVSRPRVRVDQVYRTDLEGDGQDEVLLTATRYGTLKKEDTHMPHRPGAGEYSLVLLRKIVNGRVEDRELISDVYPKAEKELVPTKFRIRGLFDADGDGTFELLLESGYYEGSYTTFFRVTKSGLEDMLKGSSASCGWGA